MKYERWVNEIFWIEECYLIIRKVSAITYDNSNKKVVLISNYRTEPNIWGPPKMPLFSLVRIFFS